MGRRLRAIADLKGDQFLRLEVRSAGQGCEWRGAWSEQVAIQARGRPHRARDGRPQERVVAKLPGQPRVGLDFEPGVAVALEFHTQRQVQALDRKSTRLNSSHRTI